MVIVAYDFRTNNQMINLMKRIILIFVAHNYFRTIYETFLLIIIIACCCPTMRYFSEL